ncbi:unnamed protein product [Prorocentrum cordatum]|uniref:Coronin n=2 Tax=Prorocentrum cordatum TaxID=2364126 RepID=A0ABN9PK40_9DINO|nr:unnamed protein product [Polarella glacialis]
MLPFTGGIPGPNVMCTFSPDDTLMLCSGVDTHLSQFEVASGRAFPERFPLRDPAHRDRYRRSAYMAGGGHFATAATEESHLSVLSVHGRPVASVDLRGLAFEEPWSSRDDGQMFVQSLRAHPEAPQRLAVLVSPQHSKRSCVVIADLDVPELRASL